MRIFRRKPSPDRSTGGSLDAAKTLPPAVLASVPEPQRGGPVEPLEDGRFLVVGRDLLMITDDQQLLDSGLWHEVQYASWDAEQRLFQLVWSQPGRPTISGQTVSGHPKELMETITDRVNNTIVATRRFVTADGVPVAASVRRRVDGELFSVVLASGEISEADQEKAYELEAGLREELGMS